MELNFLHPYPRYGFAVSLLENNASSVDGINPLLLAKATLKSYLSNFILETKNNPQYDNVLKYEYVPIEEVDFTRHKASNGAFLAPHVVSSDKTARVTFQRAVKFIHQIEQAEIQESFFGYEGLQRSYAPFSSKINKGKASQSEQKVDFLEAVFSCIATLTPLKSASYVIGKTNYYQCIIPDLDVPELISFVGFFQKMVRDESHNLFEIKVSKKKNSYRRPKIFSGNYPYAPYDQSFGPLGLLAAIGYWGLRAKHIHWTKQVLESLISKPLYVVSYDKSTKQVTFNHHIVKLALENNLPDLLNSLHYTDIFPDSQQNRDLFKFQTSRFLQSFNQPSFKDFLSIRASYDYRFIPILEEIFMSNENLTKEQVLSAKAYGAWLNDATYSAAKKESKEKQNPDSIKEMKAKLLIQLESTALSAKTPQALIAQLNTIAGRASQKEVTPEASLFIQDVMTGIISETDAKNLIVAWMRVSTYKKTKKTDLED